MAEENNQKKSPIKEIIQPFIDLVHAPRALWGINLAYVLEGMVYFGMLGYLTIHFSSFIFRGVENADEPAHNMVMVLTAGITIAMFFLGFVADKKGVRFALLAAFSIMLIGRVIMSAAPTVLGMEPAGLWSPLHITTMVGILFVVVGYGMYQPAAYAGVRKFTTPKTAAMGFAMLYALMNLGGWLPTYAFLLRDEDFLNLGIPGTYWVYTSFTLVALLCTIFILTKKTVNRAIMAAKEETEKIQAAEKKEQSSGSDTEPAKQENAKEEAVGPAPVRVPVHMWIVVIGLLAIIFWRVPNPHHYWVGGAVMALAALAYTIPSWTRWLANHPLSDVKFFFFIFALIPVQTLFTYNWFILPPYISRAFEGWIGDYFEILSNANPILIFILVPIIAALTMKAKVYNMMIIGTFVMAAPAFLLVMGPRPIPLIAYILIMTVGEAMWQPRFLQYAAEIAPEGRTGEYMGVAQLPWFLTKLLVPLLYSGWMMSRYCPDPELGRPLNTEFMWFVFGCIAITSPILLLLAKRWVGKDFKTKAD